MWILKRVNLSFHKNVDIIIKFVAKKGIKYLNSLVKFDNIRK